VKFTIPAALLCVAAAAGPASAQTSDLPAVSLRPVFMFAGQNFTARKTFETVFGRALQPFWGGGLSVAFRKGIFVDVTASRFKKVGDRAFFFEGQGYPLDIPLTVTVTPLEVTAGIRFGVTPRVFPYVGAGAGTYRYEESASFDDAGFDARHAGYVVVGGVELRVSRWVGISGDVQYTHVTGIIGAGGVSKEAGESDLGGTAGRFRIIVGR
jgi:opacity protein-like surface antigen